MLLPIYNYHPIHLAPITFLKPSPSLPLFSSQNPIKPYFHRTSIPVLAVSSDTQALPQSAIRRIAEKLRSLGYVEHNKETLEPASKSNTTSSPGQIFVPLPTQLPKHRVGHTLDPSWSTPENPVPAPGSGNTIQRFHELRHEYLKEKEQERLRIKEKKDRAPTLAELTLSAEELKRLRALVIGIRKKIIVGKAGITEGIVNGIHERWRRSELVKIKCEDLCRLNMKRTHDLLERKTGGVVIWRSGSNIILYRGADYKYPYFSDDSSPNGVSQDSSSDLCIDSGELESSSSGMDSGFNASNRDSGTTLIQGVGSPNRVRFQLPGEAELTEEADNLLEGLGPRYTDWWGSDPLPIDADLLPAIVPGYKRPFRLLPYGVHPKLTNDEMTTLKRLGRPLPCHFALGRNRKHQGLAASIVKLWEKCEIAKIAVKRGVQNTNSELMAEELKWLTGGTLLSRDREFIVFYRGKDFLPSAVSSAIEKRRKQVTYRQKRTGLNSSIANAKECEQSMMTHASDDERTSINDQKGVQEEKKLTFMEASIRKTEDRLAIALEKKSRAEKLLVELEKEEISQQPDIDKEGITEEERFMLRKVGLRMKPFLLLGRRGVFDGTVENMHLHWKYRELVKVITGRKSIEEVHQIARTLEAESGGILVAVEQVSKGSAIIMYRGKNYKRPASLRPQTLLSKREAMKRSIEAQRRQSLKLHVLKLTQNIEDLNLRLAKKDEVIDIRSQHINDLQQRETGKSETTSGTNFQSDLASLCSIEDHRDAAIDTEHSSQQELPEDSSFRCESKTDCVFDATQPTHQSIMSIDSRSGSKSSRAEGKLHFFETSSSKKPLNVDNEMVVSHVDSLKPQPEVSTVQNRSERKTSSSVNLSNRERLLLRKQALKIKKQPVLAVGRSNIVTGVAKAIKEHFKKHPLAIVNIKGRARGTSVREVVFKLEQATGAVLVSQEPSKVILYRGWGAATARDPARTNGRGIREHRDQAVISPELISAIRLECGLQSNHES